MRERAWENKMQTYSHTINYTIIHTCTCTQYIHIHTHNEKVIFNSRKQNKKYLFAQDWEFIRRDHVQIYSVTKLSHMTVTLVCGIIREIKTVVKSHVYGRELEILSSYKLDSNKKVCGLKDNILRKKKVLKDRCKKFTKEKPFGWISN